MARGNFVTGVPLAQPTTQTPTRTSWVARRKTTILWVLSLPLIAFLLVPLVALLLRLAPAALLAHLFQPQVAQAIALSMATTSITLLITLLVGTPVGYLLGRRHFRGRRVIDTLIDLPMVLPPAVAGIALLLAFGRRGLFGQFFGDVGIQIAFTQTAVVMAQLFVAAPFYVKAAAAGFESIDPELEQAAALDGAGWMQTFAWITLPLARTALLGGAVMTWARALGEFGATIIFAGNFPGRTQTMPLAIYLGFELDLNIALTLSVILLGASFLVLLIVKGLLGQRMRF
jgi:molybdate transport system permease protein